MKKKKPLINAVLWKNDILKRYTFVRKHTINGCTFVGNPYPKSRICMVCNILQRVSTSRTPYLYVLRFTLTGWHVCALLRPLKHRSPGKPFINVKDVLHNILCILTWPTEAWTRIWIGIYLKIVILKITIEIMNRYCTAVREQLFW